MLVLLAAIALLIPRQDQVLRVDGISLGMTRAEIAARYGTLGVRERRGWAYFCREASGRYLREYFKSRGWYQPDSRYTDERLTRLEMRNAKFIADYQKKTGRQF